MDQKTMMYLGAGALVVAGIYLLTRSKAAPTTIVVRDVPGTLPANSSPSIEDSLAHMAIDEIGNLLRRTGDQGIPGISSGSSPMYGMG